MEDCFDLTPRSRSEGPTLGFFAGAEPAPLGLHGRRDARTTKEPKFFRRKTFKRLAPRASYPNTRVQAAACALAGACLAQVYSPPQSQTHRFSSLLKHK